MNKGKVSSLGFHCGRSQVYFRGRGRTGKDSQSFSAVKDSLQIFATTLDLKYKLWLKQKKSFLINLIYFKYTIQ